MTVNEKLRAIRQLVIDGRWRRRSRGTPGGQMCMLGLCSYIDHGDPWHSPDGELLNKIKKAIPSHATGIMDYNDLYCKNTDDVLDWINRAMEVEA